MRGALACGSARIYKILFINKYPRVCSASACLQAAELKAAELATMREAQRTERQAVRPRVFAGMMRPTLECGVLT